jgi:multiple sugar transport system substrate-binding protein
VPFPELDNTQVAALEANQGPDIVIVNSVTIGSFVDRGYLVPMDAFIETGEINPEDFYEGMWNSGVFSDQVFGLPIDTGTRALYWNKAMFEEAGIEPPTRWDQLIDVAKQLTNADEGIYGLSAVAGERWVFLYEVLGMNAIANGQKFVNDDATECVFNQDDNWQALQFWVDAFEAGVVSQDDMMAGTGDARSLAFGNNKAAMYLGGHWEREGLDANYDMQWPDDYGVILLEGTAGVGSSTGGWLASITRDAQHPQEAYDFLEFIVNTPENLVRFTNIMPSSIAGTPLALTDEFYDPFKEVLAANAYHPIPLNPGLPEQAEVLRNVAQAAMLGQMTAQEAATSFCDQIEGTLFQ